MIIVMAGLEISRASIYQAMTGFRSAANKETAQTPQQQLEKMFPELDSGLIAAILGDYSSLS